MTTIIFKHIAHLLPIHNCVIIPDLGGFILNIESAKLKGFNTVYAPVCTIIFNPELKHNDGLLANALLQDEGIPYNAACQNIKNAVCEIRETLASGKSIAIDTIGTIQWDENEQIIFAPTSSFIHPSLYGLSEIQLHPLAQLNILQTKEKHPILRYMLGGVAASAAAVFLLLMSSTPIGNNSPINQQASFIQAFTSTSRIQQDKIQETDSVSNSLQNILPQTETVEEETIPMRSYYIIIGGDTSKNNAEKLLEKYQTEGFSKAAILESSDRYRIYCSSFTDKTEAEAFLATFRQENPAYKTAWLFSTKKGNRK